MTFAHAGISPWEWHAHPDVWALIGVFGVGYWLALTRLAPRHLAPGERPATRRQVGCFVAGLVALWVHADWPVHDIGEHYLFSVHMAQHIGFSLIAAPLLLAGVPGWLVRAVAAHRVPGWVLRRMARPLPAAVVFNVVTVVTHWPVIVNGSLRHHGIHFVVHAVIFSTAVLMWFPVLNRVEGLPMMGYPARMLYVFLQSVLPTVPASFLTFADGVIYSFYAEAPRPFSLGAVEDQQIAGALMKVYAGAILWGVIVGLFFRWYGGEQRDRSPDVLTWDEVERELRRTESEAPAEPRGSP